MDKELSDSSHHNQRFIEHLNLAICHLVFLNLFFYAVGNRFHILIESSFLAHFFERVLSLSLKTTFLLSLISLFLKNKKLLFLALSLWAIALLQSFSHIYWPSLRFDTPIQDYLLSDNTSANYSFDNVKIYLKNFYIFLLPSLVVADELHSKKQRYMSFFYLTLSLALLINGLVAIIQGSGYISFLAAGSGTAISLGRSAGLLEDSGASSIFFSLMTCGLCSVLFFKKQSIQDKIILFALSSIGLIAGILSGGRIFFGSLFVVLSLLLVLQICRSIFSAKASKGKSLIVAFASILSVAMICFTLLYFLPERLQNNFDIVYKSTFSRWTDPYYLNRILVKLDPYRIVHFKVMLRAIYEHPWMGTGLGFYYANFAEYLSWALETGGFAFLDPPSSLYLMLISECGLAGWLLILIFLFNLTNSIRFVLKQTFSLEKKQAIETFDFFCFGVLIAVFICFFSGIHLIFKSVAALISLAFAWLIMRGSKGYIAKAFNTTLFSAIALLLLCSVSYKWWTAPRSPSFRWEARGKPQVPLSISLPNEESLSHAGILLSSGEELLLEQKQVSFILKHPKELYPATIRVILIDQQGKEFGIQEKEMTSPSHTPATFYFDPSFVKSCTAHLSPHFFCSFRTVVTPSWAIEGHKVGAFLLNDTPTK